MTQKFPMANNEQAVQFYRLCFNFSSPFKVCELKKTSVLVFVNNTIFSILMAFCTKSNFTVNGVQTS